MKLEELFLKYVHETIDAEELRQLREAVSDEANRAELERLLAGWLEKDFPAEEPEALDVEALYEELTHRYAIPAAPPEIAGSAPDKIPGTSPDKIIPFYKKNSFRVAVLSAAAACLLLVAGIYLLRRPAPLPAPVAPPLHEVVIAPASNKAVLTLANGTHIILDSAGTGNLALQGNTQVIKLESGMLAYQAGKADQDGKAGQAAADTSTLYNEIATPRGGFYQLILPDGSKVWLDAASSLRFPTVFRGSERAVELRGEAYFEIAPRSQQPFRVRTKGVNVDVLGTAFNIMAYEDEEAIRTTLVNGSIRVERGNEQRLARPGQQVSWVPGSEGLQLSTPDMRQVLAWKQGEFRFEGLSMAAIMRQIARWYDVEVSFNGPQPESEFNGVIPRRKNVDELLTVLEETGEVHFILKGRKIIAEKAADIR